MLAPVVGGGRRGRRRSSPTTTTNADSSTRQTGRGGIRRRARRRSSAALSVGRASPPARAFIKADGGVFQAPSSRSSSQSLGLTRTSSTRAAFVDVVHRGERAARYEERGPGLPDPRTRAERRTRQRPRHRAAYLPADLHQRLERAVRWPGAGDRLPTSAPDPEPARPYLTKAAEESGAPTDDRRDPSCSSAPPASTSTADRLPRRAPTPQDGARSAAAPWSASPPAASCSRTSPRRRVAALPQGVTTQLQVADRTVVGPRGELRRSGQGADPDRPTSTWLLFVRAPRSRPAGRQRADPLRRRRDRAGRRARLADLGLEPRGADAEVAARGRRRLAQRAAHPAALRGRGALGDGALAAGRDDRRAPDARSRPVQAGQRHAPGTRPATS